MVGEPPLVPEAREGTLRRSHGILSPFVKRYFRSETRGLHRLPSSQTIVVTHHDGGVLPMNGVCFGVAWYDHFGFERPLYVLTHDLLHDLAAPFARLLADSGCVRADRERMDAMLAAGRSVLVFPGGARETFRSYWRRRAIDLGGRTGFVAQAIRWDLPITPVVSAGGHETLLVLSGGHALARRLGVSRLVRSADVLPLLAGFPWGVWALPFVPQIPLPAKITSEVLEPIRLGQALGRRLVPADSEDPEIVQAGYLLVIDRMRRALGALYDERRWPVLG